MTPFATNEAVRTILAGALDYAGLFPPAQLDMAQAAGNYRRYLAGGQRWALGCFVCPVGRLEELAIAGGDHHHEAWRIAAVASGEPHEEAAAIARFNQDHYGRLQVVSVEAKVSEAAAVRTRVEASRGLECFCELNPASPDFTTALSAVKHAGAHAKLRTGGIVADAIPTLERVADFLFACHAARVSFKATAGLHHPYRGLYPLTYEPDAPRALMHGFVNLALASAAILTGADREKVLEILAAESPQSLFPSPYSLDSLAAARRFFLSFGSCSFEEPLQCLPPQP